MYSYIFEVIYKRNISRDKSTWLSRHNASGVVFFALVVHAAFLLEIIKTLFGVKIDLGFLTNNRGIEVVLFLLCMAGIYLYFNENRITKIENKFLADGKIKNNGLVVFLVIFVPLLIVIALGWKK